MRSWIGRLLATTLLAGTAAVAGPAYAASDPGDAEPTACQQVWDAFPAALQDDIKAAVELPLRERRRAFHAIRYAALHGGYGDAVQAWAERVRERRIELWKEFPDQLKADVRAAWSLPLREQRRAMLAIRYAALHGEYGDRVQELAEKRREFRQGCPGVAARDLRGRRRRPRGRPQRPPATRRVEPVTYDASSLISQPMASATSAGSAARPSGTSGPTRSTRPGSPASAWMVVATMPGATPTTRMPSAATSIARPVVRASRPALAAAYWTYSSAAPSVAAPEDTLTTTPPAPPRPVLISRTAARAHSTAAVRLRSIGAAHDVGRAISASGPMSGWRRRC